MGLKLGEGKAAFTGVTTVAAAAMLVLPLLLHAQETAWRNYEPRPHTFAADSSACDARARQLTDGMSERDRQVEYDSCLKVLGWQLMSIEPSSNAACAPVAVKALRSDSSLAGALRDGFTRRFRPETPDYADVRLQLVPMRSGLLSSVVGVSPDEEAISVAERTRAAVELDLASRLRKISFSSTSQYLVTLRASCVREFERSRDAPKSYRAASLSEEDSRDIPLVRVAGVEFPYPEYLNNIGRQIALRFDPSTQDSALRADVSFLIHRDGSVANLRFLTRSGVYAFDLEAQGAVEAGAGAHAFGPLPAGFRSDVLPVILSVGQHPPQKETSGEGAYFEFQVEKTVLGVPGNPQPAYPPMLRSAGVEGRVLAQFVVDTSGRADMSTFKVLETSHELFSDAVRQALPGYRFFPAEIGGRKVRQVLQQPFTFTLGK